MPLDLFSLAGLSRSAVFFFAACASAMVPNPAIAREDQAEAIVRHNLRVDHGHVFWKKTCVWALSTASPAPLYKKIILHLSANPDVIVSRNDLRAGVIQSGHTYSLNDATLALRVCQIRRLFRDVDRSFRALETVNGLGYRWHDPLPVEPLPQLMRRTDFAAGANSDCYDVGPKLNYDPQLGQLFGNGERVDIWASLIRALSFLMRTSPQVQTNADLARALRGSATETEIIPGDKFVVRVQICRLRKLLKLVAPELLILTVHGEGYQLIDRNARQADFTP